MSSARVAALAGLAIGALHAAAIAGLLAAREPAWQPTGGERGDWVWLLPTPAVAPELPGPRDPGPPAYVPNASSLCTWTVQIDGKGKVDDVDPSSRAFLRSLAAQPDREFTLVGVPCSTVPVGTKQGPRLRANPRLWEPRPPDVIVL